MFNVTFEFYTDLLTIYIMYIFCSDLKVQKNFLSGRCKLKIHSFWLGYELIHVVSGKGYRILLQKSWVLAYAWVIMFFWKKWKSCPSTTFPSGNPARYLKRKGRYLLKHPVIWLQELTASTRFKIYLRKRKLCKILTQTNFGLMNLKSECPWQC